MSDLNTQIRDYFEAIAPPFEVGDLVRDSEATIIELTTNPRRRPVPWAAVAAAVLTLFAVGLLPWLLRGEERKLTPAATRGTLEITVDTVLEVDHIGALVVTADGVTLDCAGRTVTAPAGGDAVGVAISVDAVRDVEVRNCVVQGFDHGIAVSGAEDVVVAANTFETTIGGVGVHDSTRVEIVGNTVTGVEVDGYLFQNVRNSVVRDNVGSGNLVHFSFEFDSRDNIVESNQARGGGTGIEMADGSGNVFRRNTVVDTTRWSIEDSSGGETGPSSNLYEGNRCTGAPSTPSGVCEP